jgi:hypothetical protein
MMCRCVAFAFCFALTACGRQSMTVKETATGSSSAAVSDFRIDVAVGEVRSFQGYGHDGKHAAAVDVQTDDASVAAIALTSFDTTTFVVWGVAPGSTTLTIVPHDGSDLGLRVPITVRPQ